MNFLKQKTHDYLVRVLTNSKDGLERKYVNTEKREIYLGLFGINKMLLSPKGELAGALLVKFFKYKCLEGRIEFKLMYLL